MYGPFQKARHVLRGGAALVLALLLCAAMPARAAGGTAGGADQDPPPGCWSSWATRWASSSFARGVMVVKAPESGTPADDCGLQTGDIIVQCGGVRTLSQSSSNPLLQENGGDGHRPGPPGRRSVTPLFPREQKNEKGAYCIGAWIRDSMAGIGTHDVLRPGKRRPSALWVTGSRTPTRRS